MHMQPFCSWCSQQRHCLHGMPQTDFLPVDSCFTLQGLSLRVCGRSQPALWTHRSVGTTNAAHCTAASLTGKLLLGPEAAVNH
jgi:hypothetical protein